MNATANTSFAATPFANFSGYTDVDPFEIVRVVSDQTIEIRAMDAQRDPTWKPEIIPGGFAGHCVNNHQQRWLITSNPEGRVVRVRLSKKRGWRDANGNQYRLNAQAIKFHDYNF